MILIGKWSNKENYKCQKFNKLKERQLELKYFKNLLKFQQIK